MAWRKIKLEEVLYHRKQFITIEDSIEYKRCRVQVNRKGVVLRDIVKGLAINTKRQQVCKSGDFLVAEIDAKVGGYGFIDDKLEGAIVSSHYFLFEIQEEKMLPAYFEYLIRTDIIQSQINSRGSTNYAAIRPAQFLSFEIMLPSLKEQQEIVNKLSALEEAYIPFQEEIGLQITDLTLLRQSILQEAIQGKLVSQESTEEPASALLKRIKKEKKRLIDTGQLKKEKSSASIKDTRVPFELPEGWEWCRLADVCVNIHYGFTASSSVVENIKLLRITDIQDSKVNWQTVPGCKISPKEFEKYKLNNHDILIARTGGTIGKSFLVDNLSYNAVFASYLIRAIPVKHINARYLKIFLETSLYWSQLKDLSNGTGQPNVNATSLKSLLLPIPAYDLQAKIVEEVFSINRHIDALESQIIQSKTEADQLLQALLREAFEGKHIAPKQASKQDEVFWQKQLLTAYINMLMEQHQEQGEMAIAKYTYLNDRVNNAGSGFSYMPHNFGPYSPEIKDCLTAPDAPFCKKTVGKKGYEVYHVNKELEAGFIDPKNRALQEAQKGFRQLMQVFSVFPMQERARQLELVASICWLIEQHQNTDMEVLYNGLESWPTPKRQVQHKGQLFSKDEAAAALQLIQQQGWHLKLLHQ